MYNWRSQRRLQPYAIATMMASLAFFIGLSLFLENPFDRWWFVPTAPESEQFVAAAFMPNGAVDLDHSEFAATANGLNPLLRHFGMAIHPPMLYLGFVGFIIPFAYAMAALASGDLSTNWIKVSRRWSLVAWLFLTLGLILGGRWAYDVLGWGGYWGWDPVENAAFLPWLIGTAFLHSVMVEEKRGILKTWNMFLVIGTFSAVLFGTFATRSGLVESVHSFARSEIGFPMFAFWFTMTFISVALIIYRRSRGELRDDHRLERLLSRETLFLLNNFVFVALFIAIFWGSFGAPIVSELFMNTDITLGTDYFMQVTPPLFAIMYILMGIAPLSAWSATSLSRMGSAMVVPLFLTVASLALFIIGGMSELGALFAYGIVLLAGWVAIYETYRAIAARHHAHGESYFSAFRTILARNPRRYGGYLIHLGVTIIGLGVIGSTLYQQETQQTLAVGDSVEIGGYTLRYDSFDGGQIAEDGRIMDIANVTLLRNGQELAQMRPRRDFFPTARDMNSMTIAGAHSTVENDFYVLLVNWETINANSATFKIYINPLINLIWWGSIVLIVGTVLAIIPREVLPKRVRDEATKPVSGKLAHKGA
jgi:cytochrome c-type biogenesis protein CcmF